LKEKYNMKTFAKVLVEKTNGESTVYLFKHECEHAKHQDPLLLIKLTLNFNWKLISYELL